MSEQRCRTCQHYEKECGVIGMCYHPVIEFIRGMARHNMTPAALSELAVKGMFPESGKDCPTWHAK